MTSEEFKKKNDRIIRESDETLIMVREDLAFLKELKERYEEMIPKSLKKRKKDVADIKKRVDDWKTKMAFNALGEEFHGVYPKSR